MLFETRYLAIYLNDHYAGATGGLELARRSRSSNRGNPVGDYMEQLVGEIEADRERLREIMEYLEVDEDRAKQALAWSGEKLGRLKLNGELLSYSPLSRITELEGLYLGITGKLSMWKNLLRSLGEHLHRFDLEGLIERAEGQRLRLEELRLEQAAEVLGDYPVTTAAA